MIRIDEIYNNTFWPWIRDHLPGFRMFMCDPFGRSDPDSVVNYGNDHVHEHNYIFFFDQEPIHLSMHIPTFQKIRAHNLDITHNLPIRDDGFEWDQSMAGDNINTAGYLVTSEQNSENVDLICRRLEWQPLYYFFHGWAALDWYRGYNRTFLIQPWGDRKITKTFIAPNRIVAGERQHRLEMLYHIFKNRMTQNHVSCPAICPAENIKIGRAHV